MIHVLTLTFSRHIHAPSHDPASIRRTLDIVAEQTQNPLTQSLPPPESSCVPDISLHRHLKITAKHDFRPGRPAKFIVMLSHAYVSMYMHLFFETCCNQPLDTQTT